MINDHKGNGTRSAREIWEQWSSGGAIVPKNHPLSNETFHAAHTLLHVLWDFNARHNAEYVLLDWIEANGWTNEFEAFLAEHYYNANDDILK
jgi:hypothetical protein